NSALKLCADAADAASALSAKTATSSSPINLMRFIVLLSPYPWGSAAGARGVDPSSALRTPVCIYARDAGRLHASPEMPTLGKAHPFWRGCFTIRDEPNAPASGAAA